MKPAKIYRPTKNAMQSGQASSKKWVLEYSTVANRSIDDLMGWTSSDSTLGQIKLYFNTLEEAKAYAKRMGLDFLINNPKERTFKTKSYADNFKKKPIIK